MSSSMIFRRATASAASARSFSTSVPRKVARISIVGNLADTPESVPTTNGREMIKYAVASNHGPNDNRQTSWFRVAAFVAGPRRDYLLGLPKGTQVYLDGDASLRSFVDSSGQTRTTLSIVQRGFEVLRRPDSAQRRDAHENAPPPQSEHEES
ncbi:hypothetical protein CDD82_2854 [Ophiocordyceps australis]|uniref:Single-stranded DNA-binding protein n=1 Tax=Ophiocordyceps australis TaxID=1399860 RepID=A0A2C5ZTT8_9HYPO|nr:hypothetical protein CDD82_2854 [Ophiocordyceps australis]